MNKEWDNSKKIAYFSLTEQGHALAQKLSADIPGDLYGKEEFKTRMTEAFQNYDALVCIMASGIVVRTLAPCLVHKAKDPAVVVMDQKGRHAISLISGHLGGANELAHKLADISGGEAVITTATDVEKKISFDVFAKKHNLAIENIEKLKYISNQVVEGRPVDVITDREYPIFNEQIRKVTEPGDNPIVVIDEKLKLSTDQPVLYLRPKTISVGVGCKRDMDGEAIKEALKTVLEEEHISPLSVKSIATIGLKANEPGIKALAEAYQVPLIIVENEAIEALDFEQLGIAQSSFVKTTTGLPSVSTSCAYLTSEEKKIIRDKVKFKGITIALAR
jgi:cobalt-precorrin 5A hydrolase